MGGDVACTLSLRGNASVFIERGTVLSERMVKLVVKSGEWPTGMLMSYSDSQCTGASCKRPCSALGFTSLIRAASFIFC